MTLLLMIILQRASRTVYPGYATARKLAMAGEFLHPRCPDATATPAPREVDVTLARSLKNLL